MTRDQHKTIPNMNIFLHIACVTSLFLLPAAALAQDDQEESELSRLMDMQATRPPSPTAALAPVLDAAYVQTFAPTQIFDGITLEGTQAWSGQWRVEDGEYVGSVGSIGVALLLLDDEAYQDLAFAATFKCGAQCESGLFIHGQTSDDRISGVAYLFSEENTGGHTVAIDTQGRELNRDKLEPSPSPYPESMLTFRAEFPGLGLLYPAQLGGRQGMETVHLDGTLNHAEIHMVGTSLRGLLNGPGTAEAHVTGYGRIGLYVAGPEGTEIRFSVTSASNR